MKIWAAILWTTFTVTLVGWWWLFTYRLLTTPSLVEESAARGSRMLVYEGGTLFTLVFAGGLGLVFYMVQDSRREQRERLFFATFNHDIKTSISRLKLQAEFLKEGFQPTEQGSSKTIMSRLVQDMDRLELQLENALLLAAGKTAKFHFEKLNFGEILKGLRFEFSDLEISLKKDPEFWSDRRAMTSVLRNLMQNSRQHGEATRIEILSQVAESGDIEVLVSDNGHGLTKAIKASRLDLGSAPRAGSGMGLYLSRQLLIKMKGQLEVIDSEQGFRIKLTLPSRTS